MQGLEATLEAVANRVQSLEEVVLLLRQTTDIDPDPVVHRVRWATAEGGKGQTTNYTTKFRGFLDSLPLW